MREPKPDDSRTLGEVRQELTDNFETGIHCAACTQYVRKRHSKLGASSAYALIRLFNLTGDYHHVREFAEGREGIRRSSQWAELLHWGLIDEAANEDPTKKSSGMWRITLKGIQFVKGEITLPKYIWLFNANFMGFDGEQIDIVAALGNKFDYQELMGYAA